MTLLKEPLLHFLIAGAALFAAYAWLGGGAPDASGNASRTVRITAADVAWLQQTWARQWQRPPSEEELRTLVAGHLREELLAREARALGLDENDTIVRRRLAQKMEFMVNDAAQLGEPGEEELRRTFEAHRERFQLPPRVSFTHVYFNPDRRGAQAGADARAALPRLAAEPSRAPDFGDRFLAPYDFSDAEALDLAGAFGPEFARRVLDLPPGAWHGPIESGHGLHLVRVASRQPARPRDFASVRDDVLALWREQRERELRDRHYASLLAKYEVVVDESLKPLVGPLARAPKRTP